MNKNVAAFLRAAEKGNIAGLESYLAGEDANINILGDVGETALIEAVKNNRISAVEFLLAQAANVKIKDGHGLAAIHYAADRGYFKMVQLLVEQDATIVNDTSVREWTPLHLAARKGHYDSSGDQTAEDEETDPKGYFKTAQFLITKGANFNAIAFDENGAEWTPLALTQNQGIKDLINSQAPSSSLSMANVLGVQQVAGGRSQSSRGNF